MGVRRVRDELKEGEVISPPGAQQHAHPGRNSCLGQSGKGKGEGAEDVEEEAGL